MDEISYIDAEQLKKLRQIADKLHSMSDAARDQGHQLWLIVTEIERQHVS